LINSSAVSEITVVVNPAPDLGVYGLPRDRKSLINSSAVSEITVVVNPAPEVLLRLSRTTSLISRLSLAGWVLAPIKSLDLGEWLVPGKKNEKLFEGL
jgi:hypothetical protein